MRVLSSASPGERDRSRPFPVAREGLRAGILGGLAVALFFGAMDIWHGRPLRTPAVLGQAIFLGTPAREAQGRDPMLALAYTIVHLAIFVGIGTLAAYGVASFERRPPLGLVLLLLFVGFEAGLFAAAGALAPELLRVLGTGEVAAANALAALVMTASLWRAHVRRRRGSAPEPNGSDEAGPRPPETS